MWGEGGGWGGGRVRGGCEREKVWGRVRNRGGKGEEEEGGWEGEGEEARRGGGGRSGG